MTTFEALSLVAQFSLSIIAILTLMVAIVVFSTQKEVTAHAQWMPVTSFCNSI